MTSYQRLRGLLQLRGSKSRVFIDDCGVEERVSWVYAWAKRGKKVDGERQGKRGQKEHLVAARRQGQKDLIAPMIFPGSLEAVGFAGGFRLLLRPNVTQPARFIMANAPIHRQNQMPALAAAAGQQVLFLPKDAPDLNDIEHDFSALKSARMPGKPGTSLDEIIRDYCAA